MASGNKPQDNELKEGKGTLNEKHIQLSQDLEGDLFKMKIMMENLPSKWHRLEALAIWERIKRKLKVLKSFKC